MIDQDSVMMDRVSDTHQRAAEGEAPADPFPAIVERMIDRAGRPLGWMWNRGFRFLFVLDALALFASMIAINLVRFGWTWPDYPRSHYWIGFSLATGIHLTVNYFAGLYEREPRLGYRPWLPRIALSTAIAVAIDGLAAVLTDRYLMPRLNLGVLLLLGSLTLNANRSISRYLSKRRHGPSRLLLVGRDDAVHRTVRHFDPSDAIVVDTALTPERVLMGAVENRVTDVLLLDLSAFTSAFPEPLASLDRMGVGVHQRVSARETLLGLQAVREIAGMPFTRMRTHAMASHQLRLKRLFDLTAVIATSPLTIPVLLVLALFVRLCAGHKVIFRQRRVGQWGEEFIVVKFRTMVLDAESLGPQFASAHDDRVVTGLRWMRGTRADELPQLWNVLRGEMSLVGPRPERPEMISEIEPIVAGYAQRHELPPGMTGLAQVNGRYDTDADYKLGYDLQYMVNWSLVLDLQILAKTVVVVLLRRL